jgi:AcrR family transcriptional regulator
MPRSGAQARNRLREAALELYLDRGYDATTTAQIAERAGVTERTYFRHFADKREVLFDGEAELRTIMVDAITTADDGLAPLPLVIRAYMAAVPLLVKNRPIAERRAQVIAVTPALQERAHAKRAALLDAVIAALTLHDVREPTARLAGQVGMAVFERASRSWHDDPALDLGDLIQQAADEVRALG